MTDLFQVTLLQGRGNDASAFFCGVSYSSGLRSVAFVLGLELSMSKTARVWPTNEAITKNKIFMLLCQSQVPERAPHKRPITRAV
jgi:hypothetical protein